MTKAVLLLTLCSIACTAGAQEARNAAYFELGGSAVVPSVNYERRVNQWAVAAGDRQELFEFGDDEDETFSTAFVTGIIGYRDQKPAGGFQFRAAFTPW